MKNKWFSPDAKWHQTAGMKTWEFATDLTELDGLQQLHCQSITMSFQ